MTSFRSGVHGGSTRASASAFASASLTTSHTARGISHRYTQCSPCTGEDRYRTPSVPSRVSTWHIDRHLARLLSHLLPRSRGRKRNASAKFGCGPSTGISTSRHFPRVISNRTHEPLSNAAKSRPPPPSSSPAFPARPEPTRLMIRTDPAASFHGSGACTASSSVHPARVVFPRAFPTFSGAGAGR